ncbi:MAG: ATP-binding cassette domain-containing protein [Saprospiraceae bacterium]|nr:ATP-binding cassette domain-containing protein [Saprospiraceae bacterium]
MIHFSLQKNLSAPEGVMSLDVECSIRPGQLITLYGESGAGKTSILRMLAGLMKPDGGKIEVSGELWYNSQINLFKKPQGRSTGYVFQDYALFPNMTVRKNLEYALSARQNRNIIDELIEISGLGDLQHRKPDTLSGGQKQRVALTRSLVKKPKLLMLDEPLSAIDHKMRIRLQDYILKVHKQYNLTIILISHDVSEIFKMSDEIYFIKHGKIIQKGSPLELFSKKHIRGKFQFIGEVVEISKEDVVFIVSILVDNQLIKVVIDKEIAEDLRPYDKVLVASKAFNPMVQKIG